MKRRILCVLLALVLCAALLPMTVGAANEDVKWLDISKGEICLYPDGYKAEGGQKTTYTGKYGIYQSDATKGYTIYIQPSQSSNTTAVYDVTFRNLKFTGDHLYNPALMILSNVIVNLTLDGDNLLDTRKAYRGDYPAIKVFTGSTLNITGNGTLTTISSYWPSILTHGACQINISGENTAVKAYGMRFDATTPFAIQEDDSNSGDANLQLSVTGGATLEAYGGIRATKLKLDDTATLWSQAWYDQYPALYCEEVEYSSERGIYLYYYVPQPSAISVLHSTAENTSGTAVKVLSELNWTSCNWTLQDGVLSSEGAVLRRGVESLAISDKEFEGSLGSWALLNGQKRTITPPVTPKDPEGNLLQNLIGTGLFFVPDDFPFYDVDSNDWFYEPVKSAWEQELIDGVTARYYMPDNTLTVAQAVKLAAALHQKQSVGFVTLQNGGTHWYDNYVNYAIANGLIEAVYQSKSAEAMNAAVTRAEFVHILSKLLNTGAINTVNSIPDVKAGDAYADEIFAFYRAGILTGSDRLGTFHPESSLKRSEAAAILVRLYDATQRQYITLV